MKKPFIIFSLLSLMSCQSFQSSFESLGLVDEDPNAPVELDQSYESFLDSKWKIPSSKPLINFDFFSENIEANKFFALAGSTLYVINDKVLNGFDYNTGELKNSFELETNRIMSGVTVGYNSFVYSDADGVIYAHDLNSGNLKWQRELQDVVLSEVLITSTSVFVQTSSDVLYGLDLQNGQILWSKSAQAPLLSIRGTAYPIFFEGLVFTGFSNGRLAAVRAIDGIQLWEKPISRLKGSTELEKLMDADSPAIAINEDIFSANYNGSLTRFNIRTGEKIFSVDLSTSKPFVLYRDRITAINMKDELIGFNAINGTEVWRNQKFKNREITGPVLYEDKIYFGDLEGYLHEIDASTGMITGLTSTDLKAIKQLEIFSDTLVVEDVDGAISGFDLK